MREGPGKDIEYYGNGVSVTDQGDAIALLLSEALETEVRLVALPESLCSGHSLGGVRPS